MASSSLPGLAHYHPVPRSHTPFQDLPPEMPAARPLQLCHSRRQPKRAPSCAGADASSRGRASLQTDRPLCRIDDSVYPRHWAEVLQCHPLFQLIGHSEEAPLRRPPAESPHLHFPSSVSSSNAPNNDQPSVLLCSYLLQNRPRPDAECPKRYRVSAHRKTSPQSELRH